MPLECGNRHHLDLTCGESLGDSDVETKRRCGKLDKTQSPAGLSGQRECGNAVLCDHQQQGMTKEVRERGHSRDPIHELGNHGIGQHGAGTSQLEFACGPSATLLDSAVSSTGYFAPAGSNDEIETSLLPRLWSSREECTGSLEPGFCAESHITLEELVALISAQEGGKVQWHWGRCRM